ncbi:MAG: Fe-S-containing hydro-lyase [Peptococcaceae bacterium]|jgi:fumarate hydratase subunit beta|nr:Fe-S-containing hydro-lyase [Peptococcaceae bacterium]
MDIRLRAPLTKKAALELRAGDRVLLNGVIYTARDAAHARLTDVLEKGEAFPFDLQDSVIYYVGPSPARPGRVIGAAGPTTSYRMDAYAPRLIEAGLRGMIGKGMRSPQVIDSMKKYGAVYFGALGGGAALIAGSVVAAEPVCYEDLGTEAVQRLTVRDFPATVVIDAQGADLYRLGRADYLRSL